MNHPGNQAAKKPLIGFAIVPLLVVTVLLALYLANCFTPLRLTNDTLRYLNIKEWLEAGKPAGHSAATDFLPYGYVWFLLLLGKLHLANSFFISLIQLLYLLGSIWFIKKIIGTGIQLWQLAALTMLSWASLKFVITPLSEMQFLFFSMGGLYFFYKWQHVQKLKYLLLAVIFAATAMLTRTIGFLLPVAFITGLLFKNRAAIKAAIFSNKIIVLITLVVLAVLFFAFDQFGITAYLKSHSAYFEPFTRHPVGFIKNNLENHLVNWSALVLNAPATKIGFISFALLKTVYLLAAILSMAALVYFLFKKQSDIPVEIKAYLVLYGLVILNWPLFEPRLWVPIFPLCIAVVLKQEHTGSRTQKYLVTGYKIIYTLIGITALGYYTHTSFNKEIFAVKQDAAIWRNEYETHFFGGPLNDTATVVREPVVRILKKYD